MQPFDVCKQSIEHSRRWYRSYGELVGRKPRAFIGCSLVLVAVLTLGWHRVTLWFDCRETYTPVNSATARERQIFREFFDFSEPYLLQILVSPVATAEQPDANLMSGDRLQSTVELITYLMQQCTTEYDGAHFTFDRLCRPYCNYNEPVKIFENSRAVEHNRLMSQQPASNFDPQLNYPVANMLLQDFNMAKYFYGVTTNSKKTFIRQQGTTVANVSLIILYFRADRFESRKLPLRAWEREVPRCIDKWNEEHKNTEVNVWGEVIFSDEMLENTIGAVPYFVVGFTLMIAFVLASIVLSANYKRQPISKLRSVLIALITVTTPGLAILSGFGAYNWVASTLSAPALAVMPFLVLAVGVDDAFLLIHSWQRHLLQSRSDPRGETDHVTLLGQVCYDVGPSVTITTLTTVLAFSVGLVTPVPELQTYCLIAVICLSLDFILQLTLFLPVMLVIYTYQGSQQDSIQPLDTTGRFSANKLAAEMELPNNNEKSACSSATGKTEQRRFAQRFVHKYCATLSTVWFRLCMLVLWMVYIAAGTYGLTLLQPNLKLETLYKPDAYMTRSQSLIQRYVWAQHYEVNVFVNSKFDPLAPSNMSAFERLQDDIRLHPHYIGDAYTHLWLNAFHKYYARLTETEKQFQSPISSFFDKTENEQWKDMVKLEHDANGTISRVNAFYFTIVLRLGDRATDKDLGQPERLAAIKQLRRLVAKHEDTLKTSIYEPNTFFLDLVDVMLELTVQTVLITLAIMGLVCCLFIPSLVTVLIAVLNIASVCTGLLLTELVRKQQNGVVGFMSLRGFPLDVVLLALTLMTVGFSVDYTAHVITHYHQSGLIPNVAVAGPVERVRHTLTRVGWPTLQAAISTVLVLVCLMFTRMSHVDSCFVHVVLFVVFFGVLHGLVFVPALLISMPQRLTTSVKM